MNWYKFAQNENIEHDQNSGASIENVYEIPDWKISWLEEKLKKLNKTCAKLELPPITMTIVGESTKTSEDGTQTTILKQVKIVGEAPVLKGWKFIGRIMHTEEGNILKLVPGETVPENYRKEPPKCDHCGKNRRRNDTFVVRNLQTGEFKQCGTSCLRDFTGHLSPDAYAKLAEAMADLNMELRSEEEEGFGGGGGRFSGVSIEYFVLMTYLYVKQNGFLSRAKAREMERTSSTADQVWNLLMNKNSQISDERRQLFESATDEDKDFAKSAIAWARGLKEVEEDKQSQISDYLYNLSVSCSLPVVRSETLGLMASLPSAYQREISQVPANFEGALGKRGEAIVVSGTLKDETPYDNATQYTLVTSDGHEVKWFGDIDYTEGATLYLKGTVKDFRKSFDKMITILVKVEILDGNGYKNIKDSLTKKEVPKEGMPAYNVGDKFGDKKLKTEPLEVTILSKNFSEGQYGMTTIYNMTDKWGNNLVWFSSGGEDLDIGEKIMLQGTVKGKQSFRGKEQIVLTRCKAVSRDISEDKKKQILTDEQTIALEKELSDIKNSTYGLGNPERLAKKKLISAKIEEFSDLMNNCPNAKETAYQVSKNDEVNFSNLGADITAMMHSEEFFTKLKEYLNLANPRTQEFLNTQYNDWEIKVKNIATTLLPLIKEEEGIKNRMNEIAESLRKSQDLRDKYRIKKASIIRVFKLC